MEKKKNSNSFQKYLMFMMFVSLDVTELNSEEYLYEEQHIHPSEL